MTVTISIVEPTITIRGTVTTVTRLGIFLSEAKRSIEEYPMQNVWVPWTSIRYAEFSETLVPIGD